jgi:hypothetical protein
VILRLHLLWFFSLQQQAGLGVFVILSPNYSSGFLPIDYLKEYLEEEMVGMDLKEI